MDPNELAFKIIGAVLIAIGVCGVMSSLEELWVQWWWFR